MTELDDAWAALLANETAISIRINRVGKLMNIKVSAECGECGALHEVIEETRETNDLGSVLRTASSARAPRRADVQ